MENSPLCMCKPGKVNMNRIPVDVTEGPFVMSDERRRVLIITAPETNRVTLTWGTDAHLDLGITLYPGGQPLVLDRNTHGAMVTQAMRAISATALQTLTYAEEVGVS